MCVCEGRGEAEKRNVREGEEEKGIGKGKEEGG